MTRPTYAALWSDGEPALTGSVALSERTLRLEGAARGRRSRRQIGYTEIVSMHVARENGERLGGRPALVLELAQPPRLVRIATSAPGTLHELASALDELSDPKGRTVMRRIVIATDGSDYALDAVREGVELAAELAATVTFVCVRTPPAAIWGAPVYGALAATQTQIAQEAVDAAVAIAADAGIDADFEIVDGPVAETIIEVGRAHHADMIVAGSRGRGAVKGAVFGSVSKALVSHAECPVLVVKSPQRAHVHA